MEDAKGNFKSIIAAISGNFVEWYDFALFLFLAPIIAKQFFPDSGSFALLGTLTVYAVSFFFRPLGAIIFGHIGDKYGRSLALRMSLSLLALLSMLIAILPSYHQMGFTATLLLCLCRIGQGICLGGEFAGSMIYLGETAHKNHRALSTCLSNNGSNSGIMAAAGSVTLLSIFLTEAELAEYGYRILFFLGGMIGLIGFAYRADLKETQTFKQIKQTKRIPLFTVIKHYPSAFILLFMLVVISALGSYALIGYMTTFLQQSLSLTMQQSFQYETLFLSITLVLVPLFGVIADKYSPQWMLVCACFAYILFSVPCYYLLYKYQQPWMLLPLVVIYSMEQSCVPALMLEYFPPEVRYTGVSLTYNISMALVGGIAPLLGHLVVSTWKIQYGISLFLFVGAILALFSLRKQFGGQTTTIQQDAGYLVS